MDDFVITAFTVARIFGVPIRRQHDDKLEPAELARADKRIVDPGPWLAAFVCSAFMLVQLKTGASKRAVPLNEVLGTLKMARITDCSIRDKKGGLRSITKGTQQSRRKRFRMNLRAELDGPKPFTRIPN